MLKNLTFFLVFLGIVQGRPQAQDPKKTPVIVVPGDGGSQFEAKLTGKPTTVHYWCEKETANWFPLWLNIELLAPYVLDCTADNLRLVYDIKTRKTVNAPGVLTRQPGFGNTSSVEWLDESEIYETDYFYPIVQALVKAGWTRNVNIRGAPYDFRKAPNENGEFLQNLKKLTEDTYKKNGNRKVLLLGHSLGNMYISYLLSKQSQSWKDKYINSFINLSGPLGGSAKIMRLLASGDNLGVFVVNPLSARPMQRSMPSSAFLLPYDTVWDKSDILVYAPKRNYTLNDYKQFSEDINFPDAWEMRKDTEQYGKAIKAPGVPVHCLHGVNVSTPAQFVYTDSTWYDYQPTVIGGDGDGTVNLRSLHVCKDWKSKQSQPVYHQQFSKVDHMGILKYQPAIDYILQVVQSS